MVVIYIHSSLIAVVNENPGVLVFVGWSSHTIIVIIKELVVGGAHPDFFIQNN